MNSAGNFFGSQKVCMNGLIKKKGRLNEETIFLFNKCVKLSLGFPGGSVVKNPPAKQETWVQSLGQEDPLKKEMATHSIILAWEIPWTEKPGALWSTGSQKSQI